jgi:protein-tyrosine phosphatase
MMGTLTLPNSSSFQYVQEGDSETKLVQLSRAATEHLLKDLLSDTVYGNFTVTAENEIGQSEDTFDFTVRTLTEDPYFVPTISVKGFTSDTATLGWTSQPNITEFYTYYNVTVQNRRGFHKNYVALENPFMVENLKSGTDYYFKVEACSNYTKTCDDVSGTVNGTTMDGRSSEPRNLSIQCHYDERTHESTVHASWPEPDDPQGKITEYDVVLSGNASYYGRDGKQAEDKIHPIVTLPQISQRNGFIYAASGSLSFDCRRIKP